MFRYLVSATTGFPTPMNVAGAKTQQIQVEVVVACEEACVIEDVALRGRPVPGQEGALEASLQAMDARVTGAQVDLHPFQLNAGQPIDEAVLSRAFAGFEDMVWVDGRSEGSGTMLAELPLQNFSSAVDVSTVGRPDSMTAEGSGRIDTAGGIYVFRSEVDSTYAGDVLLERSWWAVAERSDDSSNPAYLQGGHLRRLAPGEEVALGPTGELDMAPEGPDWDALQDGLAAYAEMDAELPRPPGTGPRLWFGATGYGTIRPSHDLAFAGELQAGVELQGLWFGVAGGTHLPGRLYRPFGIVGAQRAYPVQMTDVYGLVGYRPDGERIHTGVGVVWGASIRQYEGAIPDRIVMPLGGLELRFGVTGREVYTTELTARVLFDGGSTKVRRGNEDGALGLVTTTLGLTFTWEAKRW